MIEARTCLILGAGASRPYGLPTGAELRYLLLSGSTPRAAETEKRFPPKPSQGRSRTWSQILLQACQEADLSEVDLKAFQDAFFLTRRGSIDAFLQNHEFNFGRIGRLLIAAVLLHCERDELLDRDWYGQLFDDVFPKSEKDLGGDLLSVITFNYDRSLERFFLTALQGFNIDVFAAWKILDRVKMHHVYGQVGELDPVSYGNVRAVQKVVQDIRLIRTNEAHPKRTELNQLIRAAENVVFVGFGFAPENLRLFDPEAFRGKWVIATAYGVPKTLVTAAKQLIPPLTVVDCTASQLLYEHEILASKRKGAIAEFVPLQRHEPNWISGRDWKSGRLGGLL